MILCALILHSFWFHSDKLFLYKTEESTSRDVIYMESGKVYSETVSNISDSILAFRLRFGMNGRINNGKLMVRLTDGDLEIGRWDIDTSSLLDNECYSFDLARPYAPSTGILRLELREDYEPGTENSIAVYISNDDSTISDGEAIQEGSFAKQWTLINQEQARKYKPLYFAFALAIALFAALSTDFRSVKWYAQLLLAAVILFAIQFVDYDLLQNINSRVTFQDWQNSNETIELGVYEECEFPVTAMRSAFDSIEFFVEEKPEKLYVKMTPEFGGNPVFSKPIDTCFDDGRTTKYGIFIKPEDGCFEPGNYTLTIQNQGEKPIQICVSNEGMLNAIIGQRAFIAHFFLMIPLFILVFAGIFIMNVCIKKMSFPGIFLSMLIPLCMIYFIMFVPWSQPDTGSHFLATYRFSNILLGVDEDLGRKEDVALFQNVWNKENPSLISYSCVVNNLHLHCKEPELVEMPRVEKMDYYSIVNYLPEALGLSLGRILNLGTVLCLYLSRLFILLTYMFICYWAVSRAPAGKGILAMIALLPMSLMMASAISYDPLVIAVSLAYISSVFVLKKNNYTTKDIVAASIWSFTLGALKGGGYLILLPMALMLLKKERRRAICVSAILAAGIVSLLIFDLLLPKEQLFQFGEAGNGKMAAIYALQHPLHYLNMSMEAYILYADRLITGIGGTYLAWLEWSMPDIVVMALFILGGVYSLFEHDEIQLNRLDKYILLSIVFAGVVGIPAMLLSSTNIGSRSIMGLQGRYYLPLVSLFLFAITKQHKIKAVIQSDGVQRKLLSLWGWFYIVSAIGIYYYTRIYLTR